MSEYAPVDIPNLPIAEGGIWFCYQDRRTLTGFEEPTVIVTPLYIPNKRQWQTFFSQGAFAEGSNEQHREVCKRFFKAFTRMALASQFMPNGIFATNRKGDRPGAEMTSPTFYLRNSKFVRAVAKPQRGDRQGEFEFSNVETLQTGWFCTDKSRPEETKIGWGGRLGPCWSRIEDSAIASLRAAFSNWGFGCVYHGGATDEDCRYWFYTLMSTYGRIALTAFAKSMPVDDAESPAEVHADQWFKFARFMLYFTNRTPFLEEPGSAAGADIGQVSAVMEGVLIPTAKLLGKCSCVESGGAVSLGVFVNGEFELLVKPATAAVPEGQVVEFLETKKLFMKLGWMYGVFLGVATKHHGDMDSMRGTVVEVAVGTVVGLYGGFLGGWALAWVGKSIAFASTQLAEKAIVDVMALGTADFVIDRGVGSVFSPEDSTIAINDIRRRLLSLYEVATAPGENVRSALVEALDAYTTGLTTGHAYAMDDERYEQ